MRVAGQEKMGYYPTPLCEVERVAALLEVRPGAFVRALDPCAGQGEALARLAELLRARGARVETWGVELSPQRAAEAETRLDRVLPAAWEHVTCPNAAVSLLFLNPPYDDVGWGGVGRVEMAFLDSATPKLMAGGVLVYVVTETLLANPQVARHLVGWYDDLTIYRFVPNEYEAFRQVVVVGRRRTQYQRGTLPTLAALDEPFAGACYPLPSAPQINAAQFYYKPTTAEDVRRALAKSALAARAERALRPARRAVQRPVLPLKRGHLAMLLSAGLVPVLRLEGNDGPFLVRGGVIKSVRIRVSEGALEAAKKACRREVEARAEERLDTVLVRASARGASILREPAQVIEFLKRWTGDILQAVVECPEMAPVYNFDPTPSEWRALDPVVRSKVLPGMDEPGLLPAQRHVAIAVARLLRERRRAILNAEMGFGKTFIAASLPLVLEANGENPWPVLVACPAHLVDQCAAEIREAVPLAVTRIIRPAFHKDRQSAIEARRRLRRGGSDCSLPQFVEDWQAGRLGSRAYAVVSYETLKLGPGFRPAAVQKIATRKLAAGAIRPGQKYLACPSCGAPIVVRPRGEDEERPATWADLEQAPRRCRAPVERIGGDPETGAVTFRSHDEGDPFVCNTPLFSWTALRRWSGQQGVRRWPIFGLFVADEVHKAQGGSTDVGVAVGNTAAASRFAVALTGTLFGGKSKSLFFNAFRFAPEVHAGFGYHDAETWSALYGCRVFSVVVSRRDAEAGFFNGYIRRTSNFTEKPGVSPAVLAHLLPAVAFTTLADLGYELPPYQEELVRVEMLPAQAEQYRAIDAAIKGRMMQEGRSRYLALWLQCLLNRPDTAFRQERVVGQITTEWCGRHRLTEEVDFGLFAPVVAEGQWLPKERWLADFCRAELAAGRRVLVYVRLTGERDIQPRLVEALQAAGVQADALHHDVPPRRRMEWVARRLPDVLIVNPRLVETGMNLTAYPTVVIAQVDYSLFTVWQAIRRSWRLGQTQPVKVVYLTYTIGGTEPCMEERAVALVGEKMAAAQLLYGEEVGGAIVPDIESSILEELAQAALSNRAIPHLEAIFARENRGTISPLGSPTAPSGAVPIPAFVRKGGNGRRRPIAPAPVELSLVQQGRLF